MNAKHNVKSAALIVMTSIFLSRILGFFREMLIAGTFGRGIESDSFYAAFTIPDLMFYLLIGGTLSAAFIPIFTSYLANDKEEEGWVVASNFINIITISLLIFTVLGIIFTPQIIPLVAYNFKGEQLILTIKLARIMFTAVAFTCLAGLQVGILNSYQKFTASAIGPIVYNAGIILSLLILGKKYGIEGIAYGVVVSAIANFAMQFIGLSEKFKFYKFILDPKQESLHKIVKLAIPTIIGLSVTQFNLIITQNIASGLGKGSITAFKYANIIMQLPVGIFAAGISTAIFPTLTRQIALNEIEEYKETFSLGIRTIFFITIPSAFGLGVLREPIIRLLFSSGLFSENDVKITAYALLFFSMGVVFWGGIQLITRGFYSIQNTSTPVKVGVVMIAVNLALNLIFLKYSKLGIGGLSFADSLTAALNMIILAIIFNKKIKGIHVKRVLKSVSLTTIAASVMGGAVYLAAEFIKFNIHSKLGQIIQVSSLMTIGISVFGVLALLFKMEEAHYFTSVIKRKLKIEGSND